MVTKSFKKFGLVFLVISSASLTGCSEKVMSLPAQIAEFQQKLNENAESFKLPAVAPVEDKQAKPDVQPVQQQNSVKNNPVVNPVKQAVAINGSDNSDLPEAAKSLLGEWDYKFFGQEIDVKVEEKNEVFSTNFNFNGYDYEASGKVSEITGDGITVTGDYYGEPVVVKLESLDPEKMNFTFLEGGKNIPDFIKGIPLVFNKK